MPRKCRFIMGERKDVPLIANVEKVMTLEKRIA